MVIERRKLSDSSSLVTGFTTTEGSPGHPRLVLKVTANQQVRE
jgi:hypothetical protein